MGKGGGKYFPRQSEKPNEDWVIFSYLIGFMLNAVFTLQDIKQA